MPSIVEDLYKKDLIDTAPPFVASGMQYEVIMGSMAYGVSSDISDIDIYGFTMPPRDYIFPHLRGEIPGFSTPGPQFDQFQQHRIIDQSALAGKGRQYDIAIYSIIKYFSLCMQNNPNIIDSLFVPERCVLHSTWIGNLVRENRRVFLHKGAWHKFKGYAFSQMRKLKTKNPQGNRLSLVEHYGYDVKFAYHVVRLLDEVEQILTEHNIDLERNREQLKSIRDGDWTVEDIEEYFRHKEVELESKYSTCKLPPNPDEAKITSLLFECLEHHYGNISQFVSMQDETKKALREIDAIVKRVKGLYT